MLIKSIVMDLLRGGEYSKIVNYFTDEYRCILENFLTKNKIEVSDKDTMIDIMYKVEINFPQHSGLMMLISMSLFNEDMTIGDRIERLIDNYDIVVKRLT
jgi:hypothetical protein